MATNGSIECDDSVCFKLSECDVQYGGCLPDLEERLYSPVGLPCVLFDDAAATAVEHTGGDEISNVQGALTCIQCQEIFIWFLFASKQPEYGVHPVTNS